MEVKDSSLYKDQNFFDLYNQKETAIRTGVVQSSFFDKNLEETVYLVEVNTMRGVMPLYCRKLERFGGVYNYEDFSHQTFNHEQDPMANRDLKACPGDLVLVAYINGIRNFGTIIGALRHKGRQEKISNKSGYMSEFNGVETNINDFREYTLTFKGLPTNIKKLDSSSRAKIDPPAYDGKIGSGYLKWDKTGSFTVSDNATEKVQSLKIDKPNGKIIITSGATVLTIDKNTESYTIQNKITTINSSESFSLNTKKTNIASSESYTLKSPKIDTEGKWSQKGDVKIEGNTDIVGNVKIEGNTKQTGNITLEGNLKTEGKVDLAGGSYPLIYDIVMVIGVGNLGAPVISNAIVLKTVMTKAT